MDTLKSHRDRSWLHTRTEASASSSDSYSLPSPQLVERSGAATPEAFFYEPEEEGTDLSEKVRSWTRGLDLTSLKRYLEPLQARKGTVAEVKQRDTAVKTANLIRQKQRAFSPLLSLEKPLLGTRQIHKELETRKPDPKLTRPSVSRLLRSSNTTRKSVNRTEAGATAASRVTLTKLVQKAAVSNGKGRSLKPLRSLTPQVSRPVPSKGLHKLW